MQTLCVDLDGVLAQYDGWVGIDHIGEPIPGAREFLAKLRQLPGGVRLVIFTTRGSIGPQDRVPLYARRPQPPTLKSNDEWLREYLVGLVEKWLHDHDMTFDEVYSGQGKPLAAVYIDDRAVNCRPQDPMMGADLAYRLALHQAEILLAGCK